MASLTTCLANIEQRFFHCVFYGRVFSVFNIFEDARLFCMRKLNMLCKNVYFYINNKYIFFNTMKIVYKEEEIELKQTFRTLMIYENIAKQTYVGEGSISSALLYFYCNVLACSKNADIDFNDFIDYVDEHPELLNDYFVWLKKQADIEKVMSVKKK